MSSTTLNEAELQANFRASIQRALPTLPADFKLERYISIKLGHHDIILNGSRSDKTHLAGRYDMLVKVGDQALLLVELKGPEVDVVEDDVRQALSYARLHNPIVPLVLVTNGVKTLLRRTYDNEALDSTSPYAALLEKVAKAASLAAIATDDAIRTLLAISPTPWHQILASWSQEQVELLTGEATDFGYPVIRGFEIPRAVVKEVEQAILDKRKVLVVHGPPLSGVTNTLVQLSRSEMVGPLLFVETASTPDILQFIADKLTQELSYSITKSELRGWLNKKQSLMDLVLVLDGLPAQSQKLTDLLHFASQGALQLVIGTTTDVYTGESYNKAGTQKTLLSKLASTYEVLPLSNEEFADAREVLFTSKKAVFLHGAQHNPELRFVRALRMRVASIPMVGEETDVEEGAQLVFSLNATTGIREMQGLASLFNTTPEIKQMLHHLADAFLNEVTIQRYDSNWLAATWGYPCIDLSKARKFLSSPQCRRLQGAGFVSWIELKQLGSRVLIRHEELLAQSLASIWAERLENSPDWSALAGELTNLLRLMRIVTLGELTLALAIAQVSLRNPDIAQDAIRELLTREPTITRLTAGTQVLLLAQDTPIEINFGENTDEAAIDNMEPWLVLSYLASLQMVTNGELSYNFILFTKIAASPLVLFAPRPTRLADIQHFHLHEVRDGGSLVCWENGIIEPIMQSLVDHLRFMPQEFAPLVKWSIDNDSPFLAWRLLTAANILATSADEEIKQAAVVAYGELKNWLDIASLHDD